ncbi:MAG: homocysteine S-methyltransferase family protein [Pseudomonadota bacterium]
MPGSARSGEDSAGRTSLPYTARPGSGVLWRCLRLTLPQDLAAKLAVALAGVPQAPPSTRRRGRGLATVRAAVAAAPEAGLAMALAAKRLRLACADQPPVVSSPKKGEDDMVARLANLATGGVVLLDGGMGQELHARAGPKAGDRALWGAEVFLEDPGIVQSVHEDFIRAGARVITTNSYPLVRARMQAHGGLGAHWPRVMALAGEMANRARDAIGEPVLIAGGLPPLNGSYRADRVGAFEEILPVYRDHVAALAPSVELFLCETMSSGQEGRAAALAAAETGKPVWVAWTLADDGPPRLRNGESLAEAHAALDGIPVEAVLVNCCWPESITAAMPALLALGAPHAGGYGNGFGKVGADWTLAKGIAALGRRAEVDPARYAAMAAQWVRAGATIIGGCCEIGPAHIAALRAMLESRAASPMAAP